MHASTIYGAGNNIAQRVTKSYCSNGTIINTNETMRTQS